MGKLVAIETYDRFVSLLESSGISERSLNFILDTGQLYTHGIFFNVVTFGTSTELYVPLNIAGTTKNLSLAGHTHSNYYAKNNDIDIGNSKIVSGLSDIIKYVNASIEIGNSSNPTYFYGTLKTIKNNTEYTILDTSNFSIEEKTVSGIMLQNVTTFKYGNTNYLMDYVKRLNVINTLDNIATHTNMGTTNENSVPYGFLTMYTDGELINPKYALLRINITTGDVLVRSSGNTTWRSLISSNSLPSIFGKSGSNASSGLVPSPGNIEGNIKFLCEDGTWKLPNYTTDTWREIKVNGTLKRSTSNSSGDLDFINGSNTTVEWTAENKLKINSTWIAWKGATNLADGTAGYMPAPTSALREQFLRGDGSWVSLNNYSLPKATTSALGGIMVSNVLTTAVTLTSSNGTTANRYYGVLLDKDGKAFVNIPWIWNAFTAATANAAGTAGYIQAPAGAQGKYFRGDNTWQTIEQNVTTSLYFGASNGTANAQVNTTPYLIFKEGSSYTRYKLEGAGGITVSSDASGNLKFTGTTYSVFTGASSSAAGSAGLVKQPAAGDQEKFLRGDCTWQSLTSNVTTSLYVGASNGTSTTAQSANGNVYLILKEGTSYTRYNIVGSGRASVTSDANGKITINSSGYSNFTAATSSAAGSAGLVPGPGANVLGSSGYYLRADGSWAVPTNTWNAANNSQAGYVPKLTTGGGTIATQSTEYVLTFVSGGTGTITPTWKLLPANAFKNDNTWRAANSSQEGYVPKSTASKILRSDANGALYWGDDSNTWKEVTTSLEGYVPKIVTTGSLAATDSPFILVFKNVSGSTKTAWVPLPANAFKNDNTWTAWKGATDSANGTAGYMPAPTSAQRGQFLRGDGSWVSLNNYSLPTASNSTLGGVKTGAAITNTTGYTAVAIKDGVIYYKDTNTWNANAVGVAGYVAAPTKAANANMTWLTNAEGVPAWRASNNHTHSYLPLSGGTMTGNIGMGGDSTKFLISSGTSGANSPLRGTKMPATSSNWIGLFARPGKATDEGGILLSEDTCVVYNSHDTGWGFLVVDTDLSQSDWSVDSAKAFGVNSSHLAWALGGFVKADSNDTYVLLGGGGHKLISDFATSGHNHNDLYVSSLTTSGNYLRWVKNGSNNDITIPYATKAAQDNDGTALKGNYLRKVSVANNTTNDFNTFDNMTLTGRGDPTTGASLSHAPWTGGGPAGGYGVLTYLWSGYGIQMAWGYYNNHIYIRNKYYSGNTSVWADSWSTVALTSDITKSAVGLGNVANYDQSKAIKSITRSGTTFTYTALDGTTGTFTQQDSNTTYNFSGTTFYSGNSGTAEHDCNNAVKNGHYYYSSNGPATSIGASTGDGALYVQSYSDSWVGQIAQDYRNGRLFVRGKNNGTWKSWIRVAHYNEIPTNNNLLTNGAGYVTSSGVTSVATGTGLTGGTITGTGTISINSTYQTYISHGESAYNSLSNYYPVLNGSGKWSASGSGKNAYCLIAEINTNDGYINYPITFEIGGRGTVTSKVTIRFANQSAADPDCNLFATDEATCFYLYKAAANTWRLYASSPSDSTWGTWYVYRVFGNIASRVTMKMETVSSLPSGYREVTYTGNVAYASSAGSVAWGNVSSKPATATRWPKWTEVTDKPSSFTPSSHTHNMNDIKWPGGHNLITSAAANGQEWSIDCTPGSYTGTYWLVWRASSSGINVSGTMLKVDCDTGKVSAPYGFVGNLTGNVTGTATGNVTALSINGNYLRWTKNGANTDLTIPYATNADTVDGYHASGFLAWAWDNTTGSGSPFQASVDYFKDLTKLNNGAKLVYNSSGAEYTILYSRRSDATAHGSILKWGYNDKYIRIIRMVSGAAQSTDWEKISAGYADSAGSATTCSYPAGFESRNSSSNWPSISGFSLVTAWNHKSGEVAFVSNSSGLLCVAVDGYFYQRYDYEGGKLRVADLYDLASYLPLSGGTLTNTNNVLNISSTNANSWIYFKTTVSDTLANRASVGYYSGLAFLANEKGYQRIGVNDSGTPQYWDNSTGGSGHVFNLIHSGNISSQSVNYANSAGSAGSSTYCSYPAGFTSRGTSDWSGVAGTFATDWSVNGADIMFKYDGSKLNVITDGRFYQGIDIYGASKRVLDEYDISHTKWGDADTVDGLHVHGGRNSEANKIVRTDGSGYIQCGWINTDSGGFYPDNAAIARVYCSNDAYLRYLTPSSFISRMGLATSSQLSNYLPKSGGTLSGNLTISHATSATMTASSSNPKITFSESGSQPVHLTYTDYDSYRNPAGLKVVGGTDASPAWFEAEGNMYAANFYTTSDRSKKQNISLFSEHIRKFQLKDTEKWHYGVIAQEVEEMFRDGEEGNMTVNYNSVLSYYIGLLENKVNELETKIKNFRKWEKF